jgi:hypothetical protein
MREPARGCPYRQIQHGTRNRTLSRGFLNGRVCADLAGFVLIRALLDPRGSIWNLRWEQGRVT